MLKQTIGLRLDELGSIFSGHINICITTVGTDGDWAGHIAGSGSVITPNASLGGENIYEMKYNDTTGEIILSFGDSGNTELTNIKHILVTHHAVPDAGVAIWDSSDTDYSYIDLALATYLTANPDDTCFWVEFVPKQLIKYSFSSILTGTKL